MKNKVKWWMTPAAFAVYVILLVVALYAPEVAALCGYAELECGVTVTGTGTGTGRLLRYSQDPQTYWQFPFRTATQTGHGTLTIVPTDLGTTTPTPGALPVARTDGKLDVGWLPIVTGSGSLYFDDSEVPVPGYQALLTVPSVGTEEVDTISISAPLETLIEAYASRTGYPGTTIWSGGTWRFHLWRYVSLTAGTTTITAHVYRRTAEGVETQLFTVNTGDINDTAPTLQEMLTVQPDFVGLATDRLVVKIYATTTQPTNVNVSFVHNGSAHYSHLDTPLTSGPLSSAFVPWPTLGCGSCYCTGTGPSGTVTVRCGETACGSDLALYACTAGGWVYDGTSCNEQTTSCVVGDPTSGIIAGDGSTSEFLSRVFAITGGSFGSGTGTATTTTLGTGTLTINALGGIPATALIYAGDGIGFAVTSETNTNTYTQTATGTGTGTAVATSATSTQTFTKTSGITATESWTSTYQLTGTDAITETATWSRTIVWGGPPPGTVITSSTATGTKTLQGTITATSTYAGVGGTLTLTGTGTGTAETTATTTGSLTATLANVAATVTATGSVPPSGTVTATFTGTRTRTTTATGSYSGTAVFTNTVTGTALVSGSDTYTNTQYGYLTVTELASEPIVMNLYAGSVAATVTASGTQTLTTPTSATKTWVNSLALQETDFCYEVSTPGGIPCAGVGGKLASGWIPPSTDVIYAGSNVLLSTGTSTATMTAATIGDGVVIHASPSATATATATHTLKSVNSNLLFGTSSDNTTATSVSVTTEAWMLVDAKVSPAAYSIPQSGAGGKLDTGWIDATATPTASKVPIAGTGAKLDTGWLDATATPTASKLPIADGSGKLAAGWLSGSTTKALSNDIMSTSFVSVDASGTWTDAFTKSLLSTATGAFVVASVTVWCSASTTIQIRLVLNGSTVISASPQVNMTTSTYVSMTVAGATGFSAGTNSVTLQAASPYGSSVCRVYGSSEYTGITVLQI